jgi:hypothetical protein
MKLRILWKRWSELIEKFLAIAASYASIAALLISFLPSPLPWWAIALSVVAALSLIVLIALELLTYRGRHIYAKTDAAGIRKYMHDWIEHGGRVAVWTRDMSWAQNPETRALLNEKARRSELILCLPKLNLLATELSEAGAEVCAYGENRLEAPGSRFTITFFGRDGARVAVGRAEGDYHVIDEFAAGTHPAFYIAADLIALARALKGDQA